MTNNNQTNQDDSEENTPDAPVDDDTPVSEDVEENG